MKIWTCRISPRSGSQNVWTRIKNVNGASRLSNFGIFFDVIQMISSHDCWPWTKPDNITMTRKQSNNQWSGSISTHPAPNIPSAKNPLEKFSLRFFWDQDGLLPIYYLPKGQTINAEYCSSLLVQLKEKCCRKFTKGALFLYDNAPAHRALATQRKLAYLGFQCLDHPPISPDLAPSDYHLFRGLKNNLKGRHFSSDAEVVAAAVTWLSGRPSEFFWVAFKSWSNWLRSVLSFVGSILNKSRVWSL